MESVAISKLKALLSEYLTRVKAGEEVVITDRGKPVAKIIPIRRDDLDIPPELWELERSGLARIGRGRIDPDFWEMPRPRDESGLVRKLLAEERNKNI